MNWYLARSAPLAFSRRLIKASMVGVGLVIRLITVKCSILGCEPIIREMRSTLADWLVAWLVMWLRYEITAA